MDNLNLKGSIFFLYTLYMTVHDILHDIVLRTKSIPWDLHDRDSVAMLDDNKLQTQ